MESTPDSISGNVSSMPLSPHSSPVIKRSAVTYSRRREHVSDADTSTSTVFSTLSSRAGSHGVSSPSLGEEVPPSSDEYDAFDSSVLRSVDGDVSDQDDDETPSFAFAWRKDLQNLDYDYEAKASPSGVRDASFHSEDEGRTGRPPQLSDEHDVMLQARGHERTSRADENQGPLPSLIDFSQSANHSASRSPSPVVRRRRIRPAAPLNGSDDEFSASPFKLQHHATRSSLSSPGLASLETSPDRGQGKGKQRAVEALEAGDGLSEAAGVSQRKSNRKRPSGKHKEKRTKAPTRKEREETQKATARIVADRPVSIPRVQMKQMPITQLFQKLERVVNPMDEGVVLRPEGSISDPIQPFSSSPAMEKPGFRREARSVVPSSSTLTTLISSPETHVVESFVPTGLLGPGPSETNPFHANDSSEEEMPDIGALLKEDAAKRSDKGKWSDLTELKRQLLEKQHIDQLNASDEDDDCELVIVQGDMQLVAKEEAQARRAMEAQGFKHSVGRQNQIAHAGHHLRVPGTRQPIKANESLPRGRELDLLKAAAGPTFGRQAQETKDNSAIRVNKHHLNKYLLRNAQQQAEEATRLKEEEWVRRGGRIKGRSGDDGQIEDAKSALLAFVHKGLSMKQVPDGESAQDDDDEEDDPDYEDSGDEHKRADQEEERGDQSLGPEAIQILEDRETVDNEDEDEGASFVVHRQRGRSRRPFATVHSDEEDEENDIPAPSLRGRMLAPDSSFALSPVIPNPHQGALNHRASTSSFEDHTDNGTDKENDSRLMYDRSEDKENTAVANQFPLRLQGISGRTSGLFGRDLRDISPLISNEEADNLPTGDPPLEGHRTPLGELPRDDDDGDDPFALGSESRLPARRLLFAPDVEQSVRSPHKNTRNSDGDGDEQDAPTSLRSPGAMKAGFSQFFGSNATGKGASPMIPKPLQAGGLSQFWTQETTVAGFDQLRGGKNEELSLTLDAGLQPALDISQGLRRKADEIFEKEQQYLAEGFTRKSESKPELYVNAHGFLTQTVPEMGLPGSSRSSSPSQVVSPFKDKNIIVPGSIARQPFAPIDSDMEIDLDDEQPRRRLKKRRLSPVMANTVSNRHRSGSPSPMKARNAFEVLRQARDFQYKPSSKAGKKLHKSEFIEGEAEESDDDNMMGFGLRKKKDEEESDDDDESQDQTLAELVDDSTMDAKTLAEEAVLEKVREHQEIDDQRDERLAKEIADGKHRVKRRDHGLGYEDSESDDDDEDAKMRRRKMLKKRKIEGDSLEQLANDPRTRAFVEAYHADIVDGDDFAHLQQDDMTLVDENEQDAEDEPEMEYVSTTELTRQLREAAQEKSHQPFNPLDISWLDHDDNDEVLPVKEVQTRLKPSGLRHPADWDAALDAIRPPGENERDRARMQNWAKGESRTAGAGRSMGISAVTGGGRRKTGGGSISARGQRPTRESQATTRSSTRLTKASSALSAVSTSKRNKFQ